MSSKIEQIRAEYAQNKQQCVFVTAVKVHGEGDKKVAVPTRLLELGKGQENGY